MAVAMAMGRLGAPTSSVHGVGSVDSHVVRKIAEPDIT
jgi:hypothetical protein